MEGIIIIRAVPVDHVLKHSWTSDVATLSHMPHEHHRSVTGLRGLVPQNGIRTSYVRECSGEESHWVLGIIAARMQPLGWYV